MSGTTNITADSKIALINVRAFDGHRLLDPGTVVVDGPVIGTDPGGARTVDGAGATLLPGLIDAHVHVHEPEDLHELAIWGVTTGLDMACWPAGRVDSLRTVTGTADFRSAGLPAIGAGGAHACMPGMPAEAVVRTPEDARRHVADRVAEGVDYIKGVAEAPGAGGPSVELLQALVAAAREHGLKTVIHAATVGAYTVAVESGADFITHTPLDGAIEPGAVARMKATGQVSVPTLTMMEGILAGRVPLTGLLANLAALHEAGIGILAGTDANTRPGSPAKVEHGVSLHHEFELMAAAGISAVDILRSATILPARAFGLTDRGAVEPGMRADLVLVDGDPTTDIAATRNIRATWCAGIEHEPA